MKYKQGIWVPRAIGLLVTAVFLWSITTPLKPIKHLVERVELLAYDLRLNLSLPSQSIDKRIVIVDIDEKSLQAEGHWPWARNKISRLVEQLFANGATVVAFDMVFPENEPNRAIEVAQRLNGHITDRHVLDILHKQANLFDNDAVLASALSQYDTVLGFTLQPEASKRTGALPAPLVLETPLSVSDIPLKSADGFVANNSTIQSSLQHAGFFSVEPDIDGVIRRVPLIMRHDNAIYPSLALESLRLYLLAERVRPVVATDGKRLLIEGIALGEIIIPTDTFGNVVIPYRGVRGSFPYISATDVLASKNDLSALNGAIVLIGTTATGLFDLRATPVDPVYPGVEVHANVISAMLDNHFPVEPSWADGSNFVGMLLLGFLLALLLPSLAPVMMLMVSTVVLALLALFNFWLWESRGLIFQIALPILLVLSLTALNVAYGFIKESIGKRHLKEMFGQYVPPQLVEEMSLNPESFGFEGESRVMTVLFSDVRNFTTISESLTASRLKALLNEFFTPMTRIIFNNRGTIDKYVGDMVMAFWGAPVKDEEHAYHAVVTAMEMIQETNHLQPIFRDKGFPAVNIGIGINSGTMNVGDMGSTYRRAYTVIGDAVNLASRLEAATKYYNVPIIVGEKTYELTKKTILYRELDLIKVKGKEHAVHIYQPVCLANSATPELMHEIEVSNNGIEFYRAANWLEARAHFEQLLEHALSRRLGEIYLERISALEGQILPSDWSGVYERETK